MTLIDLLANEASQAHRVLAETKPKLSKDEYLAMMRRMTNVAEYDES